MTVFSIRWRRVAATFVLAFACGATAFAQERRAYAPPDLSTVRAIAAEHGLVVAQERLAAQVGADILQAGRQRGRCRGRHRLCACRHLSARRKHRRRRLHGDSFGRAQRRRRHRLSRNCTGRDHARYFSGTGRQTRYRQVAQFRAWYRRARHGSRAGTGAGEIRLRAVSHSRKSSNPPSNWRATALWSPTTWPTRCRTCIAGWDAGRIRRRRSPAATARRCRKATG